MDNTNLFQNSPFQTDEDVLVSFVTNGNKGDQGYRSSVWVVRVIRDSREILYLGGMYTSTFNN